MLFTNFEMSQMTLATHLLDIWHGTCDRRATQSYYPSAARGKDAGIWGKTAANYPHLLTKLLQMG